VRGESAAGRRGRQPERSGRRYLTKASPARTSPAPEEAVQKNNKKLIVVGDRVLVKLEDGDERTRVGLYLPPTAVDAAQVQGGTIVATGPGFPLPSHDENVDEPWRITGRRETKYIPMQARTGDFALFFRKAAVEITFEDERYLVVPQQAILALVREPSFEDEDY
jgi:co-chaperonin GroES (HSP10)